MAKYTTEVNTLFTSQLGLLNKLNKLSKTDKGHYMMIAAQLEPSPVELIEEFGVEMFDHYFKPATTGAMMTKSAVWDAYGDEFKKQFWYEFWSKEIGQENPLDWQRLMFRELRKNLPILMLNLEQLLLSDQAFITSRGNNTQSQTGASSSESKNNGVSFSNNNNLNAEATTPQDQLNFALAIKQQYAVDIKDIDSDENTTTSTTNIDSGQPIAGYTFDYADQVNGSVTNTNDSSAGYSKVNDSSSNSATSTNTGRGSDIFVLIDKLDTYADGVFLDFFEKLRRSSLFIGLI